MTNRKFLILFAHGSRDPAWANSAKSIRERYLQAEPTALCEIAFLELAQPSFAQVVDQFVLHGATSIRVLPLFLAIGKHLNEDLPGLIQLVHTTHPKLDLQLLPAIGEYPDIQEAIVHMAITAKPIETR